MSAHTRRSLLCLSLAILTMLAGIIWRFALPGLSSFWFKYGGSMLWAVMVYWLVAALEPDQTPRRVALHAAIGALIVELIRLVHAPGLDAFRLTLAGRLLLGRVFSLRDIAAYWLAIALVAFADRRMLLRRRR